MTVQQRVLIDAAHRYADDLGWWLLPVRGKRPLWDGWPDYNPSPEVLRRLLVNNPHLGIGLNLGGSGLLDLEGDTPEGEMMLDDLCEGLEFPCWRSQKSKHRLFRDHDAIGYLRIEPFKIEFRADRHQSVLPPSPHPSGEVNYQWIINPFDVPPPPLPEQIVDYYRERVKKRENTAGRKARGPRQPAFPFRNDLDYVLRHFDLLAEAEKAGMLFAVREPDGNGNIPCYVPAELRGGKPDHHPSGIFNVRNGVLRDFAAGKNHLFFQILQALTSEPWIDIFKRYEKEAGAQSGRPHSRRIAVPTPTTLAEDRVPIEEGRQSLEKYFHQELSRPASPKTLHIVKGLPGLGKTYLMCKTLAEKGKRAVILTLENDLADTHLTALEQFGGCARRMPVLRESGCRHPDEYEATSGRGYQPSQGLPCQQCEIGPRNCPYLLGFSNLAAADQLCCAAIYHTHDGFYYSYGNDTRPVVIFDENCIDLLLAPSSYSLDAWLAWASLVAERYRSARGELKSHLQSVLRLVSWLESAALEFSTTKDQHNRPIKFRPYRVPSEVHSPSARKSPALVRWLNAQAFQAENHRTPNLYTPAIHLLTQMDGSVLLERIPADDKDAINVRFRANHPLPNDKEVFILDATANEDLIRALAPGWDVKIFEPPKVEQKGRVVQIMDYDVSRNFIARQVARHREHNPSWLVQIIERILDKHGPMPLISFKRATKDPTPEYGLLKKLANGDKLVGLYNFPCRGHTFDNDFLIVLGTPYKDEATIWELALALYGFDGLPTTKYSRQRRMDEQFMAENMGYADMQIQPIQDFLVTAELVQAIGRVRPLQRECVIYVITNARITDWRVEPFMSSELFDLRRQMRSDYAERYQSYAQECLRQLEERGWTTNSLVCKEVNIHRRRGSELMVRFKENYKDTIEVHGKRVCSKQATTTRT
ncbi:MAG: bifunctional DNA primase/polymerase [Thermoguttaceae bacterium]